MLIVADFISQDLSEKIFEKNVIQQKEAWAASKDV